MVKKYGWIFWVLVLAPQWARSVGTEEEFGLSIFNRWLMETKVITQNTVGFSPPVAARAFAYFATGMYECGVEKRAGYQSLSGQLAGYQRVTWLKDKEALYIPHAMNTMAYSLVMSLYPNMPPANRTKAEALRDSFAQNYPFQPEKKALSRAEKYVNALHGEWMAYADLDGGKEGYNRNFPPDYLAPECPGCWTKTMPGYLGALQPYWGKNRLFVESNRAVGSQMECIPFSIDKGSLLFRDAHTLHRLALFPNPEMEVIAEYWDDAPGYSGTPSGHLIALAVQMARMKNFPLSKSLHLVSLMTIALNDAFVTCWEAKYSYNLIRPISYIQRYISPDFQTLIPTPPFPEFPSGHSMQSSAGAEVFKQFFSDSILVVDSTNLYRGDIDNMPRVFSSFSAMAKEISLSRFYAGIHYPTTLDRSMEYGTFIGKNTLKNLQFLHE